MKPRLYIQLWIFNLEIGWFKGNDHQFGLLQIFGYKDEKKVYIELVRISKFLISFNFKYGKSE